MTVASNAMSSVTNMATVSGGGEINTANDTASDITTVIQVPDLTISKSHSKQFVQGDSGDQYSIVVSNAGPGPVVAGNTVTVVDTLPSGLTATAIAGTGRTCVSGTLTCARSDALAVSGMYPGITVTVNVSATAPPSVTNMATVSGGGELNTANDMASDVTSITQVADLTISKSHMGNFYQGQQGVTYTITVNNLGTGPTDGSEVLVSDTVPTGMTFVSMSGSGWTCPGVGQPQLRQPASPSRTGRRGEPAANSSRTPQPRISNVYTCSRTDVLASSSSYASITFTANVDNNAASSVTNNVAVSGGGEVVTNNDTAGDPTTIAPGPDLSIAKSHTGTFMQGQTGATYSIVVTNAGGSSSLGTVSVLDTLPSGLTATGISGTGWSCVLGTLTCTRSDALAVSSSDPAITVTVNVSTSATSPQNNTATVSGGGDVNPNDNTSTDMTTIVAGSDLTITKSHSGSFVQGQTGVTYTIAATNSGIGPTVGTVTIVDTLPTGLTATAMTGTGWNCTLGTLTCTRSDVLAASSSYPAIILTVNVAANAPSSVTNMATVSGGGETYTANTASDITTIIPPPDLTISKSHTGNFFQGQHGVTYTITVNNVGAGPTISGDEVLVSETVPAGLTFMSMSGSGWTCPGAGQPQLRQSAPPSRAGRRAEAATNSSRTPEPRISSVYTCSRTDVLEASSSYPAITFTANVDNDAASSITNNVAVSGGGEINTSNDTASDPTTVALGPDLSIAKSHTGNFMQGQTGATYSIVVTNAGGSPSVGTASVVDTLPSGLTATGISGTGWSCVLGTLTCTRSDALAVSSSYPVITVTVSVSTTATSPQDNTAAVSGGGDVNPNDNTSTDMTTIVPGSDMTITKSHSLQFFQGLTGATYTITATNSGVGPTVGTVTAVDTLPTGLTATAMAGTGWSCTLGTLTCTRSDVLQASSSYPAITVTANVANNAGSSVTNMATVSGGGESNTSNDTASNVTSVNAGPDLTIAKSHTGSFYQGQTGATYSITVSNIGGTSSSPGLKSVFEIWSA